MDLVEEQIEKIHKLFLEKDIYPFPYKNCRELRNNLEEEFKKYVPNEILNADLNTYWMFIAGLASGTIKTKLDEASERYRIKIWLEKSFFDWFPKYRFLERYDISGYKDLDYTFKLYENLRLMLLEVIKLHENTKKNNL